jgi:hypothetical protein
LFLHVNVKPVIHRPPKIFLVDVGCVQAPEQNSSLFEVVNVVLDKLANQLQVVTVDDGDELQHCV